MSRLSVICALLLMLLLSTDLYAQKAEQQTVIKDEAAKAMLVGEHPFSLQWVSWDYFGKAVVTDNNGLLSIKGEQRARKGGTDYVMIDGTITFVDAKTFTFNGTIITRVSYINNGEPCKREGEMTFKISGARKFWRLAEMNNPCDEATDYVDVRFRK